VVGTGGGSYDPICRQSGGWELRGACILRTTGCYFYSQIIFGVFRGLIWYGRAVLAHRKRGPFSDGDDDDDAGDGPVCCKAQAVYSGRLPIELELDAGTR
jgi:hypothetical protein